jgi:hypothetical protein
MKRMVEEVTLIDTQVGALYKEGAKKEQGSGEPVLASNFKSINEHDLLLSEGQGSRHTYNYSLTHGKGYSQ